MNQGGARLDESLEESLQTRILRVLGEDQARNGEENPHTPKHGSSPQSRNVVRSVMVPTGTVDMSVVEFFLGGVAHLADGDIKVKRYSSQRMVAVDGDIISYNLGDDDGLLSEFTFGMQLHTFLKFLSSFDLIGWNHRNILGIMHAVSLLGGDADLERFPGAPPLHGLLQTPDDLSLSMNIGKRFAAGRGVDHVLIVIGESIIKSNDGALGDFHAGGGLGAADSASWTVEWRGEIASAKRSGFLSTRRGVKKC